MAPLERVGLRMFLERFKIIDRERFYNIFAAMIKMPVLCYLYRSVAVKNVRSDLADWDKSKWTRIFNRTISSLG